MSLTDSLVQAIARFEGFYTAGSVAARNNNPGNLRSGPGQTGTDSGGYAIFPDSATGFAALANQVNLNIGRGLNLNQFFAGQRDAEGNVLPGGYPGYAPSSDANNPAQYAATVASWIGLDPTVPLNSIGSQSAQTPSPAPSTPEDTISILPGGEGGGISTIAIVALVVVAVAAVAVIQS
jgi:hypothetical protein